ncbi:class I SAM-dependent methyltransferase [Winogradskyella sp. UBA3174]|uniref:class I SAM-dependent methyltransferase n=1 Tax=Winogradskyella sp. UBA3174 TaxID=1947785 RepID=UPI0025E6369F|nr:class I SAM-dependent methyltransferase [Winogradskyella sp. UBA3174]|tara:strand:+ start:10265 stop:10996 length:732 start_codon:yes stop_codon:yes gene_type:complete
MKIKKALLYVPSMFFPGYTESFSRLYHSFKHEKDSFKIKKSSNIFNDIYEKNLWGKDFESKSGGGSTIEGTVTIREQLPKALSKYSISTMLDIPCGDYNWMKEVKKDCDYIGADIVSKVVERNQQLYSSETVHFQRMDLTKDLLPKVDLIFCKDCLQHLSEEKVKEAINNIKRSNSKYLLVTSYPKTWRNYDIYEGGYQPLNLLIKPYFLKKFILKIKEESKAADIEVDKTMYLFDIKALLLF